MTMFQPELNIVLLHVRKSECHQALNDLDLHRPVLQMLSPQLAGLSSTRLV